MKGIQIGLNHHVITVCSGKKFNVIFEIINGEVFLPWPHIFGFRIWLVN